MYATFIHSWNTGSVDLEDLTNALKRTESKEERRVAARLCYAIRRGWLKLHYGEVGADSTSQFATVSSFSSSTTQNSPKVVSRSNPQMVRVH